jgi:carbamoyltransferase
MHSPFNLISYNLYNSFEELCEYVVDNLEENKVIGWFQGKSEFGPRALGNRSLLANPTFDNKDHINDNIKHRESWRPYAPIMLESELHNWFNIPKKSSPYMLFNAKLLEEKIGQIPSVTHVDNTTRVQTVNEKQNYRMHTLLTTFYKRTNVPILLNTSFNVGGEPIVETPDDAIKTFINSNIDMLVMQDYCCSCQK